MKAKALEIRWHDTQPIFSVDIHSVPPEKPRKSSLIPQLKSTPVVSVSNKVSDQGEGEEKLWRLATAGGDKLVRIWHVNPRPSAPIPASSLLPNTSKLTSIASAAALKTGLDPRVEYMATLKQHTGVVNVVRFCPVGETLASAGDDGNILLWIPGTGASTFGDSAEDRAYEKESWRVRSMVRIPTGKEIYDLAWSPDGSYILAGTVDHTAYIYEALTGSLVKAISEHSHYVQGVAWDPLGQFIATQSSDRSMHIHSIQPTTTGLDVHAVGASSRMDVHHQAGGTWSNLPTPIHAPTAVKSKDKSTLPPPRMRSVSRTGSESDRSESNSTSAAFISGIPTASTSTTTIIDDNEIEIIEVSNSMDPPAAPRMTHPTSRRSSSSSSLVGMMSPSILPLRSPSPAPLPAVFRATSPSLANIDMPSTSTASDTTGEKPPLQEAGMKSLVKLYGDAASTPFFRRLSWSTDGSLLLTPAGLFEDPYASIVSKSSEGGAGGGSKKRDSNVPTTSAATTTSASAGPKPTVYIYSRSDIARPPIAHLPGHKSTSIAIRFCPVLWRLRKGVRGAGGAEEDTENDENVLRVDLKKEGIRIDLPGSSSAASKGKGREIVVEDDQEGEGATKSLFDLPYRMVYAVATLDAVFLYDTQQAGPICMFGNLHYAPFTDLTWSADGQTLVISSQDGYCSIVAFDPLELGTPYSGPSPLPSVSHVPSAQIPPVHSPVKSITPIKAPFFPATTTAIDLPTPVQDQASTSASNKREGAVLVVEDDDELVVVEEGPPKKKRAALTFVGALGGGNSK